MNLETKMAIYEAQLNELTFLVEKASEGSLLLHEGEHLKILFYDYLNINSDIMNDLHKGHKENYEGMKVSYNDMKQTFDSLKESFNIVAEIASDATGQEIPKV